MIEAFPDLLVWAVFAHASLMLKREVAVIYRKARRQWAATAGSKARVVLVVWIIISACLASCVASAPAVYYGGEAVHRSSGR